MKRLICVFVLILCIFAFVSCADTPEEKYPVMLSFGEGVTVLTENPVYALPGESVSFQLEIEEGLAFHSSSAGEYDEESGTLTVDSVDRRTNISFYTKSADEPTEDKGVVYVFKGEAGDYDNVDSYEIPLGTTVKLFSVYDEKSFVGWSFGKSISSGGIIVSSKRDYEFTVSTEYLRNGILYVYANYIDKSTGIMYYDANGGVIDKESDNMRAIKYYKAAASGSRVQVSLNSLYSDYAASFSTFYDDGTFTREGYVLVEYNTRADGSGEAYSLGSKYYAENIDGIDTLYCIWKKDTNHADFKYEDYTYNCPVNTSYAPDWQNNGVIITEYTGNDSTVVVPEKLDGKYVIAIAKNAFVNKRFDTLVLNKRIQKIEDGAFKNCSFIETVYYPDGLYSISDDAFDEACYKNFKHLYVNASIAPRYSNENDGTFAVKLSRLLETKNEKQIIVIGGSSVHEGLSTLYLEALLEGEYKIINFGTTRTTHGLIYLEAMSHFAGEEDIVIYAPENSIYMMGERELYYKTLRDLEGMNNIYRYIDISNYTGVFSAFSDFNVNYRYKRVERNYEDICLKASSYNKYGEYQHENRKILGYPYYQKQYYVTLNERYNSKSNNPFNSSSYEETKNYSDPKNPNWVSIDGLQYTQLVNHAITAAQTSGARVLFAFCPQDADAVVSEAKNTKWLAEYEELIEELYSFDGIIGEVKNYIYNHKYIYDSAFHLNDYGRAYRTYRMYLDLGEYISRDKALGFYDVGRDFEGCCFEEGSLGEPVHKVEIKD